MRSVVLASCLFLAACGGGDTGPSPGPPPANTVTVTSNQFAPENLTVARNTTVTWEFKGGTHDVTFEDNASNSARNQSTGTHNRQFANAGTVRYRCTLHSTSFTSGMIGSVIVQQ